MNYGPAGLRCLLINQCVFKREGEIHQLSTVLIHRTSIGTRTNMQEHESVQIQTIRKITFEICEIIQISVLCYSYF